MLQTEQGQIQIHTENIFPIIKKAVYSGHEVFLRELVSNGVDAISKRRMAAMSGTKTIVIDGGVLVGTGSGQSADARGGQILALRGHFLALFSVAVALGIFSACRFSLRKSAAIVDAFAFVVSSSDETVIDRI